MNKKQRTILLNDPVKRGKYKASAVAAIILAVISVFLAIGVLEFTNAVFGGVFKSFFSFFKSGLTVFIWLLAVGITMVSLLIFVFSFGKIPLFGYQLFKLGAELSKETNSTLFILVSVCLCALLIGLSLVSILCAVTQLKISRRKLSWVALSFSFLASIVSIVIIIISLVSIF